MTTRSSRAAGRAAAGRPAAPAESPQARPPIFAAPGSLLATLPPPVAALAVFAIVGAAIALVRAGSVIFNPILLALFLTTLTLPAVRALQRRGLPLRAAQAAAIVLLMVGGVALVAVVGFSLNHVASELLSLRAQIAASVDGLLATMGDNASHLGARAAALFTLIVNTAGRALGNVVYALFLSVFMLLEAPTFGRLLAGPLKELPFLGVVPRTMDATVQFMGVRAILNAIVALGFILLLWAAGIEYALLWGLLAFVLGFIPYIGLPVAAAPPVLLALSQGGLRLALIVAGSIVVVNFLVEYVAAPALTGKSLSLSPAVVLVSFFFWMFILGAMGALFAVPLTVWLLYTFDCYASTRWAAAIIGGRGK